MGSSSAGLKDETTWKNKYTGKIDSSILDSLYGYVKLNLGPGTADGTSPSNFIKKVFDGTPANVTSSLMTSW